MCWASVRPLRGDDAARGPRRRPGAARAVRNDGRRGYDSYPGDLTVHVVCSTLCFGRWPLAEALRRIRLMEFAGADVFIGPHGPHLTPAEVAAAPQKFIHTIRASNTAVATIHIDVGPAEPAAARQQLRATAAVARSCLVPLLTVPAAPRGSDLHAETDRLREWVRLAAAEGIMLAVETHAEQLTAEPAVAAELCRRVPGLGICLDPSHYMLGPHGSVSYEPLLPYVWHVRLRDTALNPPQFQVPVGQGDMEYSRLIAQLQRHRYQRALSVDVRELPECPYPIDVEVRKLKYLLESLV